MEGAPANRMAIAVLALVGIFVAFYLFAHNLGLTGPIRCGVGDCGVVQSSEYATIGPVPVSAIGLGGYVVLLGLALLGIQPSRANDPTVGLLLLGGAAFGVVFSAYLTYLEAFVINAWCQWCVMSAVVVTLIFLAALPELRRRTAAVDEGPTTRTP